MTQIKAIIFDCFGVLVNESFGAFRQAHFADDEEKVLRYKLIDKEYCSGRMSYPELVKEFAQLAGIDEQATHEELSTRSLNEPLLALIDRLRPHYKIGFLSNAGENPIEEFFEPHHANYFDAVSLSYQSGFVKPQPGAYYDVLSKLGLEGSDCIFVDDRADYCEGGRQVGMTALQYQDVETLQRDLRANGVEL